MTDFSWLSDEQLEQRVEELRTAAHKAPKGGAENNGSFAWATRANDLIAATTALERRRAAKEPDVISRPGMKVIYTLQPGEEYRFFKGQIIVVHPERSPKVIGVGGKIEMLLPSKESAIP